MDFVPPLLIVGVIITKIVDLIRNALDPNERMPKAWIQLLAFGLGIVAAFAACGSGALRDLYGLEEIGCVDAVLLGLGFGSVSSFWHEVMSALSARSSSSTPKGLLPR